MTASEKILWSVLRNRKINGMHFRRQHPFGIYILDFYCYKAGLVIEVDGEIHGFSKAYDLERTRYLESCGLKVIRFTNYEIKSDIDSVIKTICEESLSPLGETGKGVDSRKKKRERGLSLEKETG